MKRSERLKNKAGELAGKGGVVVAAAVAAGGWAAALVASELWWGCPLALLALLLGLYGAFMIQDAWQLYRMAAEEGRWEKLKTMGRKAES